MPQNLLVLALECNATGIGSPLLSNDDIVIPALEKFGYVHEDACNYVTSACWEPLAYGKSLEKNNILDINRYVNCSRKLSLTRIDAAALFVITINLQVSRPCIQAFCSLYHTQSQQQVFVPYTAKVLRP